MHTNLSVTGDMLTPSRTPLRGLRSARLELLVGDANVEAVHSVLPLPAGHVVHEQPELVCVGSRWGKLYSPANTLPQERADHEHQHPTCGSSRWERSSNRGNPSPAGLQLTALWIMSNLNQVALGQPCE